MPDELDKIRDAIARHKGWRNDISGWGFGPGGWVKPWANEMGHTHCVNGEHPIPKSIDWISKHWPDWRDFTISKIAGIPNPWAACSGSLEVFSQPTELHARLALLLAVLEAEGTR